MINIHQEQWFAAVGYITVVYLMVVFIHYVYVVAKRKFFESKSLKQPMVNYVDLYVTSVNSTLREVEEQKITEATNKKIVLSQILGILYDLDSAIRLLSNGYLSVDGLRLEITGEGKNLILFKRNVLTPYETFNPLPKLMLVINAYGVAITMIDSSNGPIIEEPIAAHAFVVGSDMTQFKEQIGKWLVHQALITDEFPNILTLKYKESKQKGKTNE